MNNTELEVWGGSRDLAKMAELGLRSKPSSVLSHVPSVLTNKTMFKAHTLFSQSDLKFRNSEEMSKVRGFIKQCSSAGVTTVSTRRIQSTCKTNSRVKKTNAHLSKNLSPRSSRSQASSNYLVSISNCLEETRETEGPWRTKICQNKSQPCNFGVSL